MRRRLLIAAIVAFLLLTGGVLSLYWAVRYVPGAYREVLASDSSEQKKYNDQMLQRASAAVADAKKAGRWEAQFTQKQINGWLAEAARHQEGNDSFPPSLCDPRVIVQQGRLTVFCRYEGVVTSVLSAVVEPYLAEPNVIGARIRKARAGLLPVPIDRLLGQISEAARRAEIRMQWNQIGGDPVALVTVAQPHGEGRAIRIESLSVGDGKIRITGNTQGAKQP